MANAGASSITAACPEPELEQSHPQRSDTKLPEEDAGVKMATSTATSGPSLAPVDAEIEDQPAAAEEHAAIYGSETDPMDSQLDLARAYIDMGDEEGARPVLMSVLRRATSASKLRRENCFCGLRQRDPLRFSDDALVPGTRVAARIEYHGGDYHGWQAQPHLAVATVQDTLETALSSIAGVSVTSTCAGRTDTGVHGFSQIIHFDDPVWDAALRLGFWARIATCPIMSGCIGRHP